jgi:hypothetical protein
MLRIGMVPVCFFPGCNDTVSCTGRVRRSKSDPADGIDIEIIIALNNQV